MAIGLATAVAGLGAVGLMGWVTGSETLKSLLMNGLTMKANTAVCFMLIGGALAVRLQWERRDGQTNQVLRRLAQAAAVVVMLVGALSCVEHLTGKSLGIDQLLFTEAPGAAATTSPGRMGPPAALSFFWTGLAVAGLYVKLGRGVWALLPAQVVGAITAFVGLLPTIGYLYGIMPLYGQAGLTGIAVHSAVALICLGVALMLSQQGRGLTRLLCDEGVAGVMTRRMVVPAVLLPMGLGWLRTMGQQQGMFDDALGRPLFVVSVIVSLLAVIWSSGRTLDGLEKQRAAALEGQLLGQQALQDSEARLQLAATIAQLGTFEVNYRTGQITLSEMGRAIHGLPNTTALTVENFAEGVHPDDRAWVVGAIEEALAPGGTGEFAFEHRIVRQGGDVRWLRVRARIEFEAGGRQPLRNVGTFLDVTEEKEAGEERERLLAAERAARAEAERLARMADVSAQLADEANRKKDEFLATLSHELRTPLTPVLLTASMLEADPEFPQRFRGDLALIRKNVELESHLISDLLDLTRIARGKLKLSMRAVDLHEVIREAVVTSASPLGARIVEAFDGEEALVWGDATRLQQIFWNLVSNALKFTADDGRIVVRTRRDEGRGVVVAEVEDNGIGIDAAVLPKLFTAFEQGDIRSERQHAGLGLGLAITRELATAHGGRVEAASGGRGRGATFTVELPLMRENAVHPSDAKQGGGAGTLLSEGGEGLGPVIVRRARILLVEDHQATLGILTKLLRGQGHEVTAVSTMAAGLAHGAEQLYDLLISDLGLPDGNGLELLERLGDGYRGRAIAVTGYGMERDIVASREAGFVEHLVKPIDITVLEAAIERVMAGAEEVGA